MPAPTCTILGGMLGNAFFAELINLRSYEFVMASFSKDHTSHTVIHFRLFIFIALLQESILIICAVGFVGCFIVCQLLFNTLFKTKYGLQ